MNRRQFLTTATAAAVLKPPPEMIDAHVHIWTRNKQYPFAPGAHPPEDIDPTAETLLSLMQSQGIRQTVLIQVIHYRYDNSYLADTFRRYPNHFQAVCRVDPLNPAAPDQLSRLVEQDGFRGVRLSPAATPEGDWIRGPLMPPLWKRCAALKVPMTLLIPASRLPDLHPLIEANPTLQVVIDHMADSPLTDATNLLALARYPNVSTKLSHLWTISSQPYPYSDTHPRIEALIKAFTPRRLMAATDWPISRDKLTYAQAIDLYRTRLNLPPFAQKDIVADTTRRLWLR